MTGAGGFVGSAVVRALVRARRGGRLRFSDGAEVGRVVGLLRPGGSTERLDVLGPSDDWTVDRADVTAPAAFADVLARLRPRVIAHLALDPRAYEPLEEEARRALVDRPLEVLFDALEGVPGGRVVTTGSAAVLVPGDGLDEGAPTGVSAAYPAYSRHKLREERVVRRLGRATGVAWIHLRLFYLFGRFEDPSRLLPHLVHHLSAGEPVRLSSGEQVRDFTDVDEAARAYVRAVEVGEEASDELYHIGSGRGISVGDFARTVTRVVGSESLLRFGEADTPDAVEPRIVADAGRARRRLGWAASQDTEAKIREAARWWLERGRGREREANPTD